MMRKPILVWLCIVLLFLGVGCGLQKKSKYSNLQLGKIKLMGENNPTEAIDFFVKSIEKEPITRPEARVLLLIAYRRAMKSKVAAVTQAAEKYRQPEQELAAQLKQDVPTTAEQLIRILADQNRIQKDAAQFLTELGSPAVPKIVEGFQRYAKIQDVLLGVLRDMGAEAVDGLIQAATDTSLKTYARLKVLQALEEIQDPKAIPVLRKIRESDPDEAVRMQATVALFQLGERNLEQEILAGLDSGHILARRAAARAVASLNPFPLRRALKALDDPDSEVRLALTQAVQQHPDKEAIDPLFNLLLNDPDDRVKNEAQTALANFGKTIAPRLVQELPKSDDWKVRLRIVLLLENPNVIEGIDRELAYEIDQYFRNKETHPSVKEELAKLLSNPALPQ